MLVLDPITELVDPAPPSGELDESGRLELEAFEKLAKRCARPFQYNYRKEKARERWLVYTEDYKPQILQRLADTLLDKRYLEEVSKFVDVIDNPALDAIRQTSVVWVQGATRSIADASADEKSAFTTLVTESLIDVHAVKWNRLAEFVGPLLVVPAVRKGKLRWDVLLPTFYDVIPDPEDPLGTPIAAAWTIRGTAKEGVANVVVLDGLGWRYASTYGGKVEVIERQTVEHGLGRFPGSVLRFDEQYDCDWYGPTTRHQRFVDASVNVGTIRAQLGHTRKAQNSWLLAAIGYLGDATKQQPLDPETGIAINVDVGPGKQPPTVQTLNYDTPPDNFDRHAASSRRAVAAAYGGTLDDKGKLVFDTAALTEVRNEQIPRARAFEHELWVNAIAMCQAMNHRLGTRLPDPQKVDDGFAVDFGPLARVFADPEEEAKHDDWLLSKGAIDQLDILRAQGNQNLDDEQLKAKLIANLENQAWFNDAVTKRNLGMTPGGVATAAEANGALGPAVRDGTPITVQVSGEPGDGEIGDVVEPIEPSANEAPEALEVTEPVAEAPAGEPAPDVQAEALNGAQTGSFILLCDKVATGQLPLSLIARFLPIAYPGAVRDVAAAEELLSPLNGFVPRPLNSNAPEGAPAKPDGEAVEE